MSQLNTVQKEEVCLGRWIVIIVIVVIIIVFTIFIQALKLIRGATPTLGNAYCLTQPTDPNVIIIMQKHPE